MGEGGPRGQGRGVGNYLPYLTPLMDAVLCDIEQGEILCMYERERGRFQRCASPRTLNLRTYRMTGGRGRDRMVRQANSFRVRGILSTSQLYAMSDGGCGGWYCRWPAISSLQRDRRVASAVGITGRQRIGRKQVRLAPLSVLFGSVAGMAAKFDYSSLKTD